MLSLIVPIFNIEDFLPRCLDSVLAQTYRDLEIILVNDGSTDGSGRICDLYAEKDARIKVIHKENGGVSSARNIGLGLAKGDYIGFVDGDDLLDEKMCELLVKNIEEYDCDIACCQLRVVETNGKMKSLFGQESRCFKKEDIIKNYFFDDFTKEMMYSQCNKIFKAKLLDGLRYKEFAYGEDILFVFEALARSKKIHYDDYVGYYYMHRETSAMRAYFSEKRLDYIAAIRIIEKMCEENFRFAYDEARRWVYQHVLVTCRNMVENGLKENSALKKEKKYLKSNSWILKNLPAKRKADYIGVMYFPVYFKGMKFLKSVMR